MHSHLCPRRVQMHLVNNDGKRALECFERILKSDADNVDALKLAGMLYAQVSIDDHHGGLTCA
eukprot:scaffold45777_cov31-Tisochrysis_lutea.AAC.2